MTAEKVVGAKYVVTGNSWSNARVGTLVTLEYDDGSDMPRFTLPDGNTQWIPMQAVVKLIGCSGPSEDKVTPKFAVGDKVREQAGRIVSQIVNDAYRELIVNHDKPKYAVGDIVVYTGGGIFSSDDWEVARRITAVDLDNQEYVMEWADGTPGGDASGSTFAEVEQNWEQFTGEIPAAKTAEQSHITAEQFAAIKVGDKLKLRTDLEVGKGYGTMKWWPEKADLAERGITPVVTHIDADGTVKAEAEDDYWWYTAEMIAEVISEPEFDCPELVAGQVYVAVPYAYFSNEEWLCRYFPYKREVAGSHTATFGGSAVSPEENFHIDGFLLVDKWRKATAEETAKLEAAEKEHGYVPPLVNKVGTVIEAGKYYVLTGSTGRKYICKIESTNSGQEVFYKNTTLVELAERAAVTTDNEYTDLESIYGKSAVPATGKQIALYDAAVALREAQKALKEAA